MKTQGIKIDFSSKAVKRRRLFSAKVCLAAFIAVTLTFYSIVSYLKGRVELGRKMQEAAAIEEKQAFLNAAALKEAPLPGGIALKRNPYWTTLLTRLEERLPETVVISEFKGASRDNRIFIAGGARAMDKTFLFVENLEKDNGFEGIVLISRASPYNDNVGPAGKAWDKGVVGFSIEAIYRPPTDSIGGLPKAGR